MTPLIDSKRTIPVSEVNWADSDYPDYGHPGSSHKYSEELLVYACPGCGKFTGLGVGEKRQGDSQAKWQIVKGSLDDLTKLSLTPSIYKIDCCGWHGFLTDGVYRSC